MLKQKEIEFENKKVVYTHKVSNRIRTMRLAVYHDGRIVVTSPSRISEYAVTDFVYTKVRWIIDKVEYFKLHPRKVVVKHTKEEIMEYKKQAGVLARLRLEHFNSLYQYTYKNITIKNTTSRWGSCSSKGNLNFNYKIVLLPQELSDYIIVHELCHLAQMNHSPLFWKLVEKSIPDYKKIRKELRHIF